MNLSSDQGFNNAAEFCRKVRTINDEMFGHQPSSPIRIDVTVKSSQYPIVVRVTRPLGLGAEALQKIIEAARITSGNLNLQEGDILVHYS